MTVIDYVPIFEILTTKKLEFRRCFANLTSNRESTAYATVATQWIISR